MSLCLLPFFHFFEILQAIENFIHEKWYQTCVKYVFAPYAKTERALFENRIKLLHLYLNARKLVSVHSKVLPVEFLHARVGEKF